jgi:integrase
VVKLILGKKVWMTWELDLGKPEDPQQRYFTEDQLRKIIEGAEGQYLVLFALLAGTGMRIGEASGLHVTDLDLDNRVIYVRRGVWNGQELFPRTRNAIRKIDIDPGLAELLRQHFRDKKVGCVFEARNGSPISGNSVLKRVLHPLTEAAWHRQQTEDFLGSDSQSTCEVLALSDSPHLTKKSRTQ